MLSDQKKKSNLKLDAVLKEMKDKYINMPEHEARNGSLLQYYDWMRVQREIEADEFIKNIRRQQINTRPDQQVNSLKSNNPNFFKPQKNYLTKNDHEKFNNANLYKKY